MYWNTYSFLKKFVPWIYLRMARSGWSLVFFFFFFVKGFVITDLVTQIAVETT